MNTKSGTAWLSKAQEIAWALFLIALPVTSFPYLPASLGGKALVRPLSVYPLLILLILVTLPRLVTRPLPRTLLPFLAFLFAALMSSLLALSLDSESLRGVPMEVRLLRGLSSLAIGAAIYLTVTLLPRDWNNLEVTLRWLYGGFSLALAWGSLQVLHILKPMPMLFAWMSHVQGFISTRKLFPRRVSGLTYEPKWFAEQLCMLLLPWLLAAALTGSSVFPWRLPWKRLHWLTVEWILLVWGSIVLVFTYSRSGLFILILLVCLSVVLWRFYRSHPARIGSTVPNAAERYGKLLVAAKVVLVGLVLAGLLYFAGVKNNYFARLWTFWGEENISNSNYLEYIAAAQRFVYAETALRIFQTRPLFGVGLGNYAFYFDEMLPDRPYYKQPDVIRQITPSEDRDRLITAKNLYAKILAEMGLVGIATFLAFIIAIVGCVLYLFLTPTLPAHFWGLAGVLALVVFVILSFSFDSFAIPNAWVVFGLITSAAWMELGE